MNWKAAGAAVAVLALAAGCSSAALPGAPSATASTGRGRVQAPSAAAIATRLKAVGLPITHLIIFTPVTDPNHLMGRQGGYASKVAWQDARAVRAGAGSPSSDAGGTEFGGGIEVFSTAAAAQARYAELRGFSPPLGDGYDYLAGTAILRLSQYLTPAQAQEYKIPFDEVEAPQATANSTQPSPSPTPTPSNTGPIHTVFIASGFTNPSAKYSVRLDQVILHAAPDNSSDNAPPGKYLVGAEYTIKGLIGTTSDDANSDTHVLGSDGAIYTSASEGLAAGTNFDYGQWNVQPGQIEKGWVSFELPDGVKPVAVQWELRAGIIDQFATWKLS